MTTIIILAIILIVAFVGGWIVGTVGAIKYCNDFWEKVIENNYQHNNREQ